jgi:glutathione S-transferase
MTPTLTVFERSPDQGRGLARDMRVRWALEEAGRTCEVRTVGFEAMKDPAHLARHPFGQIPVWEEPRADRPPLVLFESGAIVLHIARDCPVLLPADPDARARATAWVFAAVDTVEPPVFDHALLGILDRDQPWFEARRAALEAAIAERLDRLADRLGEGEWLDGAFSAGDLMMVTVLRRLNGLPLLADRPSVAAYVARGEARPAFRRAFAAQRAQFENAG